MSKILTACFSAGGVTKKLAERIAEVAGSDFFEIVPKTPYSQKDLDWMNKSSRSSVEMNDKNSRPEIAGKVENMDQYDVVFVGFPIWWYEAPRIIQSFLESYDFSGKTVVTFATSGSSGIGKTVDILKASCSPQTKWAEGIRLSASADKKTLENWINGLGL